MNIIVDTPNGPRSHGVIQEANGKKYFCRTVDYNKDRMRIFDAYSINPQALKQLREEAVDALIYKERVGGRRLGLRLEHLELMLKGEMVDSQNRKLAWEDEFSGGPTVYIKISAFTVIPQ